MQYFECSVKNATQNYGCSEILKKTSWSFFLLEPRGTGKSWWTKKTFADALRVDLLDAATLRELAARPERLRDMVHGAGGGVIQCLWMKCKNCPNFWKSSTD